MPKKFDKKVKRLSRGGLKILRTNMKGKEIETIIHQSANIVKSTREEERKKNDQKEGEKVQKRE